MSSRTAWPLGKNSSEGCAAYGAGRAAAGIFPNDLNMARLA